MAGDEAKAAALANGWEYADYKMTIFPNSEEKGWRTTSYMLSYGTSESSP